jgi:hypothetical protein
MRKILSIVFVSVLLFVATPGRAASPAGDEAKEIINDIISVVGLKANFEIRAVSDIPNAAAITLRGKRFIAYNPQFIAKLNSAAGNKWASVSVLAHEIGHHLNGHTLANTGSQPPLELEADEFSGFVLQKMGASLPQAQAAMKIAANYKPSLTHPGQRDRLVAIEKGWSQAGGKLSDMAKYSKPVPPPTQQENVERPARIYEDPNTINRNNTTAGVNNTVIDSRHVLATVDFPSDRTASYYVTIRLNLVKVMNGQLYLLGKMLPTNSSEYPFIMKGNSVKNTLFVDRTGKIVTADRQLAGYLKKTA